MRTILDLRIAGLGVILYSPFAVAHIRDGQDYLSEHYSDPADVARQVMDCGLTGFCTGSPSGQQLFVADGSYRITAYTSAPPSGIVGDYQDIGLHFEAVPQRPLLRWDGVPDLTCG